MATKQPTHADSLGLEDVYSPLTPPPGKSSWRVAESSPANCETTTPSASEGQDEKTSDEDCGTASPPSSTAGTEDSSDGDLQARLSEFSLQENEVEPDHSASAGIPKVEIPQVAPSRFPLANIREKLPPPRIVTVGRAIKTLAVQVELDQDFCRNFALESLCMDVGLLALDTNAVVDDGLKGRTSFHSNPPVAGLSDNGSRVLKFVFLIRSIRVKKEGSYRVLYSASFPDARGFLASRNLASSGFVTRNCPRFTCDEMEFIEEQERLGHLRLREDGDIDIVVPHSG